MAEIIQFKACDLTNFVHHIAAKIEQMFPEDNSYQIFGIPRGGVPVAYLVAQYDKRFKVSYDPKLAHAFVDDIIDSGATRTKWQEKYGTPVLALLDKTQDDYLAGKWVEFPWERYEGEQGPEDAIIRLIQFVGEDPNREGLLETPSRVLRAFKEMTEGYSQSPKEILSKTFDLQSDEMVLVEGIRFTSLCEHHLLPFTGHATVAYIPQKDRVVGLSKIARLVECFARRFQVQEVMTNQIANAIEEVLRPEGVGVIIKAHHQCMGCRGVRQPDARMITSSLRGVLLTESAARAEFLALAGK